MIELWSINRWLRWTGFVLVVVCDGLPPDDPERRPTCIGLVFVGWPPERAWVQHCERNRKRKTALLESLKETQDSTPDQDA